MLLVIFKFCRDRAIFLQIWRNREFPRFWHHNFGRFPPPLKANLFFEWRFYDLFVKLFFLIKLSLKLRLAEPNQTKWPPCMTLIQNKSSYILRWYISQSQGVSLIHMQTSIAPSLFHLWDWHISLTVITGIVNSINLRWNNIDV